jgi:BirA family biotin operon repressor/biotin-[acetyl-CoA-carboxylase] ligase
MQINYIKLDTTNSTNDFLKSYSKVHGLPNLFYVFADIQTAGRGQREHIWQSDCCKNLLVSFLVRPTFSLEKQILLNKIVSIALVDLLQKYKIDKLQVKLPNDIMADNKKIAGILIENSIHAQKITQSIIGIGLNVNQTNFVNLPQAVSMKNIMKHDFNVAKIAHELMQILKQLFSAEEQTIQDRYNALSFFKPNEIEL